MNDVEDRYLDLTRLSEYSSMSISMLRDYLKNGQKSLPHFKLRGKILVKRSEFDQWMKENFRGRLDMDIDSLANETIASLKNSSKTNKSKG